MPKIRLVCQDIKKSFWNKDTLNGVSFSLEKNQTIGIIGPNKSGKTTLLACLLNLIKPSHGQVKIDKSMQIGFLVGQGLSLEMTGYYHLEYLARVKGYSPSAIEEMIALFHLNYVHQKVKQYSQGMIQRLKLAMAFLNFPEIIILDNPTDYLDHKGRAYLGHAIHLSKQRSELSLVIASHDIEFIELFSDKVFLLKNGKITQTIFPKENVPLSKRLIELKVDQVGKAVALIETRLKLDQLWVDGEYCVHIYSDQDCMEDLFNLLVREGIAIYQLTFSYQSLLSKLMQSYEEVI